MPLVTELWFTALTRVTFWRGLFVFGVTVAATSIATAPIWFNTQKPLPREIVALWVVAGLSALIGAQRWRHWRRVMKANIFHDGLVEQEKRKPDDPVLHPRR